MKVVRPKEAEAKLEALDKSHAMIELDGDGTILDANENFLRTMGFRRDELRGQHHSWWSVTRPANRPTANYGTA